MTKTDQWQFWIDRGGTFTDIVARRPDGHLICHKLLSENPQRYQDATVQGIRDVLGLAPCATIPPGRIAVMNMGTTVGTNALLERTGAPTLLLITQGFGDLLRIGYQNRPRLFDLHIRLPSVLYEKVIEVPERIDAAGTVITALDLAAVRASLRTAYEKGYRAAAIALMHGYRHPAHEQALGALARELGFSQVSLSHQVSPLIKLVARGDTTVLDAYLSPILRRYLDQLASELGQGCERVRVMQSHGGLIDRAQMQGKDAILSGPAGGVVGMVRTAQKAGFDKLIGFDMGGTSTDVCHYAGDFERSYEKQVAGVRMRVPMMHIHTVAAGGGSILSFRQGRLQVGPQSAGADPGPACYQKGGPLTVTDANVVLGRIQPAHFPHVFGPDGDAPIDPECACEGFARLAADIARETDTPQMSIENLAQGFVRIANENMAAAIKKISVERGYHVADYTMNCFGGAGGQHACDIAALLGITRIYSHPFAGVLSALGMGLADVRVLSEHQFQAPLTQITKARTILDQLTKAARQEVLKQAITPDQITAVQTAHIRTGGSHHSLPIAFADAATMRADFIRAHRHRFGFAPAGDDLIIDVLAVEAIGAVSKEIRIPPPDTDQAPATHQVSMYLGGQWCQVPLMAREAITAPVPGPALVIEPTGTNVIAPGWQADALADGSLLVSQRAAAAKAVSVASDDDLCIVDPILLEVFNNLFMSIAEQMGVALAQTAYSVNIRERLDFSCAIFDGQGDLVANAPHVPVHLGSMSECVRTIHHHRAGQMRGGDVFMMNNPFKGGTHLPDVTVITPVFEDGAVIFYLASRGHHADIGGTTPGSAPPDSRHIDQEGVLIDDVVLVKQGVLQDRQVRALLASGPYPCRNIDQNMKDLSAQIAANTSGMHALQAVLAQYGPARIKAYMGHVQDNAEHNVRRVLADLQGGSFTYPLDSGAQIKVNISVDQKKRQAKINFQGTSPQDEGNYNAPLAVCRATVLYVFRTLVGEDIPMNEGCLRPIDLHVPLGSMLNPRYPAAVISGNTEVSQAIADSLFGALGVIAGSQGTMNNFVYGNQEVQNYETIGGGTGAGPGFDGTDAVHSHMTNTLMTDPEVLETRFPVRVDRFSIRSDSGGAGRHRGGHGIHRRLRFLDDMTVTVLSSHRRVPPHGAAGGHPGKVGKNQVVRSDGTIIDLAGNDQITVARDDVFVMKTPGGGGYGVP
ncbi:MAG: hydantoinase B/oxoprolinase family protein [Pseudomonadota bacterium]